MKAVSLLDEALSLTESLRMEPLTERVTGLRTMGDAKSRPTHRCPKVYRFTGGDLCRLTEILYASVIGVSSMPLIGGVRETTHSVTF